MNSEQRCHEGTLPNTASPARTAGHLPEHEKEQHDGDRVQQDIGEVMSASLQPVQLAVQHVRNCRQRVPVSRMTMDKSADDTVARKASRDRGVFVNIYVIVKIDEIVCERLTKNQPGNCDQDNARIKVARGKFRFLPAHHLSAAPLAMFISLAIWARANSAKVKSGHLSGWDREAV